MLGRRLLQSTKLLNCLPSKLILGGRTTPETAGFAARCFSGVVNLSDEKAVHKFRMLNHKSVLYFTANWCGPCRMIKPLYEELAKQYENEITFGKVDVDENDGAAVEFEIEAVPTFVLFNGETAVERFSGADATRLQKLVQELSSR